MISAQEFYSIRTRQRAAKQIKRKDISTRKITDNIEHVENDLLGNFYTNLCIKLIISNSLKPPVRILNPDELCEAEYFVCGLSKAPDNQPLRDLLLPSCYFQA